MKKRLFLSLTSVALFGVLVIGTGIETEATTNWSPNSPDMIQIKDGEKSYTLVLGDTLWAISQRTNLTVQTLAEVNSIDLSKGEQYFLPVGRVIYFEGDVVTVKDNQGNVINETTITDENKVNPNQGVGETVNPSVTEPTTGTETPPTSGGEVVAPEVPTNPIAPVEPTDPAKPVDPVDPVDPTDPEEPEVPEGPYVGAQIPGVANGIIGTYTDDTALMDAMDDYKLANDLHGSDWDYLILSNGYGWYAVWVNQ
ncbi:LysM peptidoglycan-binding domain-containing protein [Enterococcus sp. AZ192]|uniref:LysM peptidoglycan-binding domain-containing protein n=1 Tax=unclassified Enterococcus TaxID=2608891 RepID=UPI003D296EBA